MVTEQNKNAQAILNELLNRGLLDTETVDEIAEDLKE